ncbi:MAG: aldehyde dehydrogenase family protein [Gammaproteobacteria bacterium]|nr:aldehyde dehydrogenase family protein [Gammaproteobacteria bacterium]
MSIEQHKLACLERLGLNLTELASGDLTVMSPIDGSTLGRVTLHTRKEVETVIDNSVTAFGTWRSVPAPKRGELIRIFGEKLRHHKDDLGELVTLECGKILQEGLGEVQEMIDICDFAVGLSRQLYGLTIVSERFEHKMLEYWHPLGPVGVISAFNFPVAVWAWNTALAIVCGDTVIWKPSEKAPLTALACEVIFAEAVAEFGEAPAHLVQILIGDATVGMQLVEDTRVPVISATGSCAMGKIVAPKVAARMGRTILELGGNNAITVCPTADLDMAVTGIVFGAVGTAGQRCTTTRRIFIHESVYDDLTSRLKKAYASVTIANPLDSNTLVGPLIDKAAFDMMQEALKEARANGAITHGGERFEVADCAGGYYVQPALVEMPESVKNIQKETFAPILYLFKYSDVRDAIHANNDVQQGLSSSIFTNDIREAELFTSAVGSDCGIANVNIGTSGAEIGGAFGGEKETGGGRESGSDAWKGYMRRSTCTINYSSELPLAQGVQFDMGSD